MTWVKLDDNFPTHPKAIAAGDAACWLYVAALCWAKSHLTDGVIPTIVVPRLTGARDPAKLAARLVEVGLWEDGADDGYRIHDYAEHNLTRAEVEADRESAAARKRRSRGHTVTASPVTLRSHRDASVTAPSVTRDSPARVGAPAPGRPRSETETETETETRKMERSVVAVVSALRPLLPDVDLEGHVPFWLERFLHLDIVAQVTELRGKYGRKPVDASRVSNWLGVAEAKRLDAIGRSAKLASKPIPPEIAAAVARIEDEDWDALTKDLP